MTLDDVQATYRMCPRLDTGVFRKQQDTTDLGVHTPLTGQEINDNRVIVINNFTHDHAQRARPQLC